MTVVASIPAVLSIRRKEKTAEQSEETRLRVRLHVLSEELNLPLNEKQKILERLHEIEDQKTYRT